MQESSPRDNNLDSDTTAPFGKSVNMNADRANERNLPSSETGSPLSELERALSVLAKHCDPMVVMILLSSTLAEVILTNYGSFLPAGTPSSEIAQSTTCP